MIQSAGYRPGLPASYDFGHSITDMKGLSVTAKVDAPATISSQIDARSTEPINILDLAKRTPLKLFLETSDESFEESLMAGGYGRYRTREWVPQPQTMLCGTTGAVITPVIDNPSPKTAEPEPLPQPTPTEKELKKRRRLAAFRTDLTGISDPSSSKLFTIELEGKGRVLSDIPNTPYDSQSSRKPVPQSAAHRKKKKEEHIPSPDTQLPDWPDSEFPWRLRSEERVMLAQKEQVEKLQWIEKFLDRDSDEDDVEPEAPVTTVVEEEDVHSSNSLPEHPRQFLLRPEDPLLNSNSRSRSISLPSDPADARTALLAQTDIRALSRRSRSRRRRRDREKAIDREPRKHHRQTTKTPKICLCRGSDDGRELVRCSNCQAQFHLVCLGFQDKEEVVHPWWCPSCSPDSGSSDAESANAAPLIPPRLRRAYGSLSMDVPASEAPVSSDMLPSHEAER